MSDDNSLKSFALISATMAVFLTPFMASATNLAIPAIGEEFQASALELGWVVSSFLLASAALLLPLGRLGDMIGRKKIYLSGIFLFSVFSFLCGSACSIEALMVYRVLQGIGSAMIFGTNMAILTSVYAPQERGRALGINGAAAYLGLSLGPAVGGLLTHRYGWQSIFYFSALLGSIVLVVIVFKLKGEWFGQRGKYDRIGAVLYCLGLVSFMYGLSTLKTHSWGQYWLLLGVMILGVFMYYETKVVHPLVDVRLFLKNWALTFSNWAAFINFTATYAVTFLMSLYLQSVRGYDSQLAGLILLVQPLIMVLLSPMAGSLSDRVDPRKVAALGMAITTLGLFAFCFLRPDTPIPLVVAVFLFLGAGFGLFSSPNNNAAMNSVSKEVYGLVAASLGTMRLVGQSVSMAIVTLMLSFFVGNVELEFASKVALIQCIRISFMVFTVLCFAGIFISLAGVNVPSPKEIPGKVVR